MLFPGVNKTPRNATLIIVVHVVLCFEGPLAGAVALHAEGLLAEGLHHDAPVGRGWVVNKMWSKYDCCK